MIDCTVACPLLPAYAGPAGSSGAAILMNWAKHKTEKHGPGCMAANRNFTPLVVTTLGGIGANEFWGWFDAAFGASIALHVAGGGSGREIADRKQAAIVRALTALHNATAHMAHSLSRS